MTFLSWARVDGFIQAGARRAGRWAGRHWPWLFLFVPGALLGFSALAPLLAAMGADSTAGLLYRGFGRICHQMPSRSLWIAGRPMAICARDVGLYAGMFLGMWIVHVPHAHRMPAWGAFLFAAPMALDGSVQFLGLWESANSTRLWTGFAAGLGVSVWLMGELMRAAGERNSDVDCLNDFNEG